MVTQLDVIPFQKPCTGVIELPGSKSISNRALLLSCFNKSAVTTLFNILKSEDVEIMIAALKSLGVNIKTNWAEKTLSIEGCAGIAVKETEYTGWKCRNCSTVFDRMAIDSKEF